MKTLLLALVLLFVPVTLETYPLTVSIITAESRPHLLVGAWGSGVGNYLDETGKIRGFEYSYGGCRTPLYPRVGLPGKWLDQTGHHLKIVLSAPEARLIEGCILNATETGTIFSLDQNGKLQSRPQGHE